jgi:uncharacterized protein YcaQ
MPGHPTGLDDLRRFAVARSLFPPTTLARALNKLGFVQADPIRAPARAQDLTLRHRVSGYRAGDLERRYPELEVEEDVFINYGYVTRPIHALMHPRELSKGSAANRRHAETLLAFVRERGTVHPRDADQHFARGTVTNYWGGSSSATTHMLVDLHYRGLLHIVGRDRGIRIYAPYEHAPAASTAAERDARIDALVDVAVNIYAPVTTIGLSLLVRRLRYAVPQWSTHLRAAMKRAKARLSSVVVDRVDWYWPTGERLPRSSAASVVRLLSPFDPVVWDRGRFERLWAWPYRFEAYTPAPKRKRGYYALPLLWREQVIGWSNLAVQRGELHAEIGYVDARPRDAAFKRELDLELDRVRLFLGM